MKKVIILLIICLIGFGIFGCNRQSNISINEEKTNFDKISIEDNDVKNILSMVSDSSEDKATIVMDDKIRSINKGASSFYFCQINNKKYDTLCAYIDESLYQPERFRNYDYYITAKWYKYTEDGMIQNSINNLKLTGIFRVYDVEIICDIINDKLYNRNCKYYLKIDEKMDELNNILLDDCIELKYNNLIIWEEYEIINNDNYFITNRIFDLGYEVRMDLNEKKRVIFDRITAVSNGEAQEVTKFKFGESYKYFYEYFEDEQESEKAVYSTIYYEIYEKVSIELEQFVRIIKGLEKIGI